MQSKLRFLGLSKLNLNLEHFNEMLVDSKIY